MSVPAFPPMCYMCDHYQAGIFEADSVSRCPAFPDGIPPEIWGGMFDHTEPLHDEKILFKVKPGEEGQLEKWFESRLEMQLADFDDEVLPTVEEA